MWIIQAGFPRDLREFSATAIVKKAHPVVLGDQDVWLSVIIRVSHRHAHPAPWQIETAARAHILKPAIALLMKKLMFGGRIRPPVLKEEQIHPAIRIKIKDSDSR